MAISEVKNLTGGAVRYSHVKLFIVFEAYFLCEILNLGGLVPGPPPPLRKGSGDMAKVVDVEASGAGGSSE
jgi:hypothetical protein